MPAAGKDYRGAQNCMLSGWGLVKRYPQTLADRLQKVSSNNNDNKSNNGNNNNDDDGD